MVPSGQCPRTTRTHEQLDAGKLDILQWSNDGWARMESSIDDLCSEQVSSKVVFLPGADKITRYGIQYKLEDHFKIPASFWSPLEQESSGYFKSYDEINSAGKLLSYGTNTRFEIKDSNSTTIKLGSQVPYLWHRIGLATHWTPTQNILFCLDPPTRFRDSAKAALKIHKDIDSSPFALLLVVLEEVIKMFDKAVWSWRDRVREIERTRRLPEDPHGDYEMMHELARHCIHSTETLAIAIETTSSMICEHAIVTTDNPEYLRKEVARKVERQLRNQMGLLKCLHLRSKALEDRLRNEINLVFNMVAQHDSQLAAEISKAAKADSAAMRTVSLLGLIFLPATFICALFSTSFFSFTPGSDSGPERWVVSRKFWVYFVVTIPVTLVAVLFWAFWERRYLSKAAIQSSLTSASVYEEKNRILSLLHSGDKNGILP